MATARFSLSICLIIASTVLAQATRPVTQTSHDLLKTAINYNRRMLLDAYINDGTPKDELDAQAKSFMQRMAVRYSEAIFDDLYRGDIDVSDATMSKLADGLAKCDNPLVTYCRAMVYRESGDEESATSLLKKCATKILAGNYPAHRKLGAVGKLIQQSPKDEKLLAQREELVARLVLEPVSDPMERRLVFKSLHDDFWRTSGGSSDARQRVLDKVSADPKADAWLISMLRGVHEIGVAWDYRGIGLANTVTEKGWEGFREHIALARTALAAAYAAEPTYPEAAANLITVCMAESAPDDEARQWFDRAKAAQVDYIFAWSTYMNFLQPRWGGSLDKMQALAREAVDSKRFDTYLPFYAVDIVIAMTQEQNAGDTIYRRPGVWDILASVYDGYLDPPGKNINVPWVGTNRTVYAWKCGQYAEVVRMLDILGEQARPDAAARFNVTLDDIRAESKAMTGPFAAKLKTADDWENLRQFPRARDAFANVLSQMKADDPDRPYVYRRHAATALTVGLSTRKPYDLPMASADDLLPFSAIGEGWSVKDGMLVFQGKGGQDASLLHRAILPPFVHVKVEWSYTTADPNAAPALGVVVQNTQQEGVVAVRTFPSRNGLTVEMGRYTLQRVKAPDAPIDLKPDVWHTLDITHFGKKVTVLSDGQPVFTNFENGWLSYGKPMFGFVARTSPAGGELRIRKVTFEPFDMKEMQGE